MKRKRIGKTIVLLAWLFLCSFSRVWGETIIIPGDVNSISFYTKFFYNLPAVDFIYYLNDRFLFSEAPDGKISSGGLRDQLQKIVRVHNKIKDFIRDADQKDTNAITINLKSEDEFKQAQKLMNLLGLYLKRVKEDNFEIYVDDSAGCVDYYKFAMLDIDTLAKQLNKTKLLYFKLIESEISIPWDFHYIDEITGLDLDASSFFGALVENERLSLLLGILYRLSSREADFMDRLSETPRLQAWKQIYQDKEFLIGLYVLATALRVEDNHLALPGGEAAGDFWSTIVGVDYKDSPFEFLEKLATREEGKINYLYLFSFYLPDNSRKALLFDYDPDKILALLPHIYLDKNEKIGMTNLPELRDFNFYTLLYALKVENGRVQFPGGIPAWLKAIKKKDTGGGAADQNPGMFELFVELLESSKRSGGRMNAMQKFISLYSKFQGRPQLLTEKVINTLYANYGRYNVLIDFMEKIPIQKPGTILKSFEWLKTFSGLNSKNSALFATIFQSLFEIFSQTAKYAPGQFDYDRLVTALIDIPMTKPLFADALFDYFAKELKIRPLKESIDRSFENFVLTGVENRPLHFNNMDYRYMAKELYRDLINEIRQSQEVSPLANFVEIIDTLDGIVKYDAGKEPDIAERINEAFLLLPQPDISEDAPKQIRDRIISYSKSALENDIADFIKSIQSGAPKEKLQEMANNLKGEYLLPHLKDYLLSFAYALNAKNPGLRFFINPNLIRLHNFCSENGDTCWNFSGRPKSKMLEKKGAGFFGSTETETFSGFYLRGGLSRLNIVLADAWKDHLFGRNVIFNTSHVKAFITNLLDCYPVPVSEKYQAFSALLVDFGLELLQKARVNETLRQDVIKELGLVTTGYHYRSIIDYIDGKKNDYYLFFSELRALGERFFKQEKYLKEFSAAKELAAFYAPDVNKKMPLEIDSFGSIYYNTFGSLKPCKVDIFPQEVTNIFASGWSSGEMIDEFKVKVAYHTYKKGIPFYLAGEFLYQYLDKTSRKYYSQNHEKDYFSTYFIFDIFNNAYLNQILKNSQEKGYLRIK